MDRISVCRACQNESSGAKTRIEIPHTCERRKESIISIQAGDKFRVKNDIEKTVYVFESIELKRSFRVHCKLENNQKVILEETRLTDLEYV